MTEDRFAATPVSKTSTQVSARADDALVLIVHNDGHIVEHSSGDVGQFWRETTTTELRGEHISTLWPDQVASALRERIRHAGRRRSVSRIEASITEENTTRVHDMTIIAHGRDRALVICRDVTERASMDQEVRQLAFRDTMTRLPNRAALLRRLGPCVNDAHLSGQVMSVLRIHLRGLDYINRTFGRQTGSELVATLAGQLDADLKSLDGLRQHLPTHCRVMLARTEGNEYSLLVEGCASSAELSAFAQATIGLLGTPMSLGGSDVALNTCIGIARFPQDANDVDTLMANAGIALYDARKHSASAVEFFTGTAQVRSLSRMDTARELRWALDNEQFSVHYQPCIDAATGRVTSAEALLRWVHPLRGPVPLTEILPIAEMNNLADAIGEWVISTAWREAATVATDEDWYLSLNLFARQSFAPGLTERATALAKRSGVDPTRLRFEIRASDFHRDLTASERTARELRDAGFQVVLDECGLNALSPRSILRTGIRQIKLSRQLVNRLPADTAAVTLTRALLAMAKPLGVEVCATGVENEDQATCLRELACDRLQGYYLCEPLGIDELKSRLTRQTASAA
ncbi:MAG: putative bifunctional diguanylate cyclase/phosphodiesterase [Gammaproteobacteria bacterium]